MSDVLIYLIGLADALKINLIDAALDKLRAADQRFPPDHHRGVAPTKQ